MKLKKIVLCMGLSFFALSSFALTNDNTNANDQASANSASSNQAAGSQAAGDQQANNQDGQVVAFLIVLNKNEVAAGKVAQQKAKNAAVKKYAAKMVKEHNKNLQETMKLAKKDDLKPVDNDEANNLKQKGQDELSNLKSLKDQDFQTAYMDNMVQDHQAALDKLDQVIPNVSNAQLKQHLENTRKHVANHLQEAKDIQNQVKSQS